MVHYLMLLRFTDKGVSAVHDSPKRAESFRAAVAKAGGNVEAQYWTLGEYDGALIFSAPDEPTAVALAVELGKLGNVRTAMLRAFDAVEFKAILAKVSS